MQVMRRAKDTLETVSTLAVIAAAIVLIWRFAFQPQPTGAAGAASESVREAIPAELVTNKMGRGRVAIVEFTDFQCPFCGQHARQVLPEITKTLVSSGDATYIAMHFPLEGIHPNALKAAQAAECAAKQGKFWEMHDRLFTGPDATASTELRKHASALGLDLSGFDTCLASGQIEAKVRNDVKFGAKLGVNGTPSFFLGTVRDDGSVDLVKRLNGPASVSALQTEVAALSKQRK